MCDCIIHTLVYGYIKIVGLHSILYNQNLEELNFCVFLRMSAGAGMMCIIT